jgi:hypothetical protein
MKRSQSRGAGRTTPRPVALTPPTPTPTSPLCARACPGLHPNAQFPSSARQPQNLNGKNYPQQNQSWDCPQIRNKRVTNLQFGWRGSPGRYSAHARLFGLQIGAPEHPTNTFPHCHSYYQTEPPASCQLEACRAEPSPEGGCPSRFAASGADSRAGAPPEDAPIAIEDHPSRLCVASFPPSVSATVSEQNEFLSTSRSHRS